MSIFGKILAGLGMGEKREPQTTPHATPSAVAPAAPDAGSPGGLDALLRDAAAQNRAEQAAAPSAPVAASATDGVDVAAILDDLGRSAGQSLNWRSSIVDLLKLLKLDSSLEARKALALELNCPHEKLADSAQMNIWLHQQVMQKLAENGGQVPANLR